MEPHRDTRQKQAILDILRSVTSHPTADELYLLARNRLPNISLGTVYRNLERMASSGQVVKIESAGSQKRFDACTSPHSHIRCVVCGQVGDITVSEDVEELRFTVETSGYEVIGHRVDFFGICPVCKLKPRRHNKKSIVRNGGSSC